MCFVVVGECATRHCVVFDEDKLRMHIVRLLRFLVKLLRLSHCQVTRPDGYTSTGCSSKKRSWIFPLVHEKALGNFQHVLNQDHHLPFFYWYILWYVLTEATSVRCAQQRPAQELEEQHNRRCCSRTTVLRLRTSTALKRWSGAKKLTMVTRFF